MNAVEIEQAISDLALLPFDGAEFPFAFLAAFGNKDVTLKRLRSGDNNKSDVPCGVLQRNNIHMAVCEAGKVGETLAALRASPATTKGKVKFILATDGVVLEAEDLLGGETIASAYPAFPDHFGFFLPLAGISTIKEIKDNPIDVRATGRLNKLYIELLRENPEWAKDERRADMNHFMARLVFCFFAEDTAIFNSEGLFSRTVEQYGEREGANTNEVLEAIFRAMNIKPDDREAAKLPRWTNGFPYVNGGLFSGSTEVPRFSRMARTYLIHAGHLNWKQINPDIFGSMIQAVADDEERGSLGMHYTSVPNILKVLNPLFLDELRAQLETAGDNNTKLLNLRKRMARIRVFDPACGSGNFLVIAYKQLREIEAEINRRRGEPHLGSEIPLTNFRGVELRDFPAEIARLALIIAEFQCDVLYRGQKDALAEFLPLNSENWIVRGNALQLDWLSICPPTGTGVKLVANDLFGTPPDHTNIDFENEGGETYICGNPPYLGSKWQSEEQKADLKTIFDGRLDNWKSLDYVAGWFMKAADYGKSTNAAAAFVSTNSICQGLQVPILWPTILDTGNNILFAHTSFKWTNLASKNAGVIVVIVGIGAKSKVSRRLFSISEDGLVVERQVDYINAYLVPGRTNSIEQSRRPISETSPMLFGNMPRDGGGFVLDGQEKQDVLKKFPEIHRFIRPYLGSEQMIQGKPRWCIWIDDADVGYANDHPYLSTVLSRVKAFRLGSAASSTRDFASRPHRFVQIAGTADKYSLVVAKVSSERRPYLPVDVVDGSVIVSDLLFALYDAPLWNMALIASRLHLIWIATVCGKMKNDFRYSNTLGWNTFPVPKLTEKNINDLTACAEEIILARERYYPQTISDLYLPDSMPEDLRRAHEINDETLERIYIGRRFKNDTERLEKLFELYSKMTTRKSS